MSAIFDSIINLGTALSASNLTIDLDLQTSWKISVIHAASITTSFTYFENENLFQQLIDLTCDSSKTYNNCNWHKLLAASIVIQNYFTKKIWRDYFVLHYEDFINRLTDSDDTLFPSFFLTKIFTSSSDITFFTILLTYILDELVNMVRHNAEDNIRIKVYMAVCRQMFDNVSSECIALKDVIQNGNLNITEIFMKLILDNPNAMNETIVKSTLIPFLYCVRDITISATHEQITTDKTIPLQTKISFVWTLLRNNKSNLSIEILSLVISVLVDLCVDVSPRNSDEECMNHSATIKPSIFNDKIQISQRLQLIFDNSIYAIILKCLNSDNAICRKRGIFVLNTLHTNLISSETSNSECASNVASNNLSKSRHWIADFLDVFYQIDNSSSMHLIDQVSYDASFCTHILINETCL